MPWLTWPYSLCKIGEQGSLSGRVVVRTVVSRPTVSVMHCQAVAVPRDA